METVITMNTHTRTYTHTRYHIDPHAPPQAPLWDTLTSLHVSVMSRFIKLYDKIRCLFGHHRWFRHEAWCRRCLRCGREQVRSFGDDWRYL